MAAYSINIPAPDDNISMEVGDTLTITFVEARRFCSPATASTYFSPALPNGPQAKDYVWTGTAQEAGSGQTINHHAVGKDVECDSKVKRSGARSIQIGSGKP